MCLSEPDLKHIPRSRRPGSEGRHTFNLTANCSPQQPNQCMLSPPAFAQDGVSDYVLANICLLGFIFANLMGVNGISLFFCISHLNLHFLSVKSNILSCSLTIWVSSEQIADVHYFGHLIAAFATSYRKPNEMWFKPKNGILLSHITRSPGVG